MKQSARKFVPNLFRKVLFCARSIAQLCNRLLHVYRRGHVVRFLEKRQGTQRALAQAPHFRNKSCSIVASDLRKRPIPSFFLAWKLPVLFCSCNQCREVSNRMRQVSMRSTEASNLDWRRTSPSTSCFSTSDGRTAIYHHAWSLESGSLCKRSWTSQTQQVCCIS